LAAIKSLVLCSFEAKICVVDVYLKKKKKQETQKKLDVLK